MDNIRGNPDDSKRWSSDEDLSSGNNINKPGEITNQKPDLYTDPIIEDTDPDLAVALQKSMENFHAERKSLDEMEAVQIHPPEQDPEQEPAPNHLLSRVERVFTSTINSLIGFLGFSNDYKINQDRLNKHNAIAFKKIDETVIKSKEGAELHRSFKAEGQSARDLMSISSDLFVEPEKLSSHDGGMVHEAAAQTALNQQSHVNLSNLHVNGFEVEVVPISFDMEDKPVNNQSIVPTSLILGKSNKLIPGSLTNVYVFDVGPEKVVIRTGVIDTEAKLDNFIGLISDIHAKYAARYKDDTGKDLELRVVSNQLNAFEVKKESQMIQNQHRLLAIANDRLKGKAQIIHINTPSNRWYNVTKWVDSLGMLGRFIKSIAPMNFLQGEKLSNTLNLPAMGIYVNWLGDDLSELKKSDRTKLYADDTAILDLGGFRYVTLKERIDMALANIENLKTASDETFEKSEQLATFKNDLKDARNELKEFLKEDHDRLNLMEESLLEKMDTIGEEEVISFEDRAVLQKAYQMVSSMRQVLGSQLRLQGQSLDRGQEGMAIQMLNDRLGIISAMNCKSGLDRTGIWHAIKLGMLTFEKKTENGPKKAFEMVHDWDSTTTLVNKLNARFPDSHAGEILENMSNDEFKQALGLTNISNIQLKAIRDKMDDVLDFRKEVLNNLITIGIPITIASTGVMGLKWNTGHEENIIPLNFLPSHIARDGEMVALVKYNNDGEAIGITKEGAKLLTKHQKLRGS